MARRMLAHGGPAEWTQRAAADRRARNPAGGKHGTDRTVDRARTRHRGRSRVRGARCIALTSRDRGACATRLCGGRRMGARRRAGRCPRRDCAASTGTGDDWPCRVALRATARSACLGSARSSRDGVSRRRGNDVSRRRSPQWEDRHRGCLAGAGSGPANERQPDGGRQGPLSPGARHRAARRPGRAAARVWRTRGGARRAGGGIRHHPLPPNVRQPARPSRAGAAAASAGRCDRWSAHRLAADDRRLDVRWRRRLPVTARRALAVHRAGGGGARRRNRRPCRAAAERAAAPSPRPASAKSPATARDAARGGG